MKKAINSLKLYDSLPITYYQLNDVIRNWFDIVVDFGNLIFGSGGRNTWSKYPPLCFIACANDGGLRIPEALLPHLIPMDQTDGPLHIVGYKLGSYRSINSYHSSKGGVLPFYRRKGIAKKLQSYTDNLLRSQDVIHYTFNTMPNKFKEMFNFGVDNEYSIVNYIQTDTGAKVTFQKNFDGSKPFIIAQDMIPDTNFEMVDINDISELKSIIDRKECSGWKKQDNKHFLLFS